MLVPFPTKAACSIGSFACRAHGSLGVERLHHTVRLPLHHSHRHGLFNVSPVFIETGIVDGYANVSGRPRRGGVGVADPAHVSRLEVLFALLADCEPRVREFNANLLVETRGSKSQDILVSNGRKNC